MQIEVGVEFVDAFTLGLGQEREFLFQIFLDFSTIVTKGSFCVPIHDNLQCPLKMKVVKTHGN